MKHAVTTGGRRRISRLALTALVSLVLVTGGTSSVATGADEAVSVSGAAPADASASLRGAAAPETAPTQPAPADASAAPDGDDTATSATSPAPTPTAAAQDVPSAEPTGQPVAEDVVAVDESPAAAPAADTEPPAESPVPSEPRAAVPDGASAGDDAVAPLAIPSPTGDTAVITVKVGGDRTPSSAVGGLADVRLRLYDGGANGPTNPVDESWATCASDAHGDCSFAVPDTQQRVVRNGACNAWFFLLCVGYEQIEVSPEGANHDRQFWVVQEAAPAGWYTNPTLVTGGQTSQQATAYRFRTATTLRAGSTYAAGSQFMASTGDTDRVASSGRWQVSRANPQLPLTCDAGIDVALVLDLSGSVANAGAVGDLKASAIAFAEAMEGTGSRLALFTFADSAPRSNGTSGRNYPLTPVDGNLGTIRHRINGYAADGGTNWDRGIHQVAQSSQDFDLAIVITDGLATFSGARAGGPGNVTRFVETEQAIFSANALKAEGTRVLAVGVGDGINGHAHNLRAVSGPHGYAGGASANTADYFQTDWRQLAPLLENLAKGATCQSTITVDKVVEPYAGSSGPGAGWTFAATRTAGAGSVAPAGAQITGAAGSLEYAVRFDRPDAAAATVRIEERPTSAQRAAGWSLTGVRCAVNGDARPVSRSGDAVSLTVAVGDDVACTFTNTQTLEPAVEIVKQAWDVASVAALAGATELAPGATVKDGTTVTWTYTVRNTGQTPLSDISVTDRPTVDITCPRSRLAVGEHMVCTGSAGLHPRP